jgi:Formyl transferase
MRTAVICHDDARLDREGLVRWLGSFSTFTGTVVIREPGGRLQKRINREIARVGALRFVDVLAFRLYYRLVHAAADRRWERLALDGLRRRFERLPAAPEVMVASPNSSDAERFLREQRADLVIARCKTLLKESIFSIPRLGTYVMHPGICPEYRNAHGCFWARALGDDRNVGMTLLRIDKGVDTGPVYGYFRVQPDPAESHVVTQHRVVLDHLDAIREKLLEIEAGAAQRIETTGRASATWGQPWLSAYLRMRTQAATREAGAASLALSSSSGERRADDTHADRVPAPVLRQVHPERAAHPSTGSR